MRLCSIETRRVATALLLLCCIALAGCGNKNKRPDDGLVSDKDPVRGFLATIPADTPYAFVAVEPMPLGPMLGWMGSWADSVTSMMQNFQDVLQDEYLPPETKLVYALMDELSGKYTPEGLKSLGFSVSPRFALYGIAANVPLLLKNWKSLPPPGRWRRLPVMPS